MYEINQNIDKISLISNLCIKRNNLIDILNELNIDYIISYEIEEKGLIITEKKYYFKYFSIKQIKKRICYARITCDSE